MAEIRPFVLLQDWMFDLGLNPSEVIAVAVIYGFTQDGQHTCHASLQYFQRRCCIDKRNIIKLLSRLEEKGILKVERRSGKMNEYSLDFEVVTKRHPCQNVTRDEKAKSGDVSSSLSPLHPPIPNNKDNKYTTVGACAPAPAHTHTCESVEGMEPIDDNADGRQMFHVSSMVKESVGFDKERIAGIKRARMAEALERVAANLVTKEGLPLMTERQRERFLDHWCSHSPGSDRIRAEGDPYFSIYAKAKIWVDKDCEKDVAKVGGQEGCAASFTPPTIDEVKAFFAQAAPGMDPLEFFGYYKARGWVFPGGVRMSDWKSAVYMWISRDKRR